MHMEPPSGDMSQFHLHEFDNLLGQTLNDHPDLEIYMSADHGMNFKKVCYDLNTVLPAKGSEIFFAMSAERDPYVKHHRTFGGTAFVFLNSPNDFERVSDTCRRLEGIEAVYDRYTAASKFLLHPDRIGDMIVTGDINTVFGPLENSSGIEDMPANFRTHGGSDEGNVPLIVYNRAVDHDDWHGFTHNFHVTKPIGF